MVRARGHARSLRQVGRTAAFAAALICLGDGSAPGAEPDSLAGAYADAFRVGVAIGGAVISGRDPASLAIVETQFNSISPENVLKPQPLNPEPGVWNFAPADAYVEFGEAHGMFIIGHTLVWHNQTPDWFFVDAAGEPNSPAQQIERMREHIETVAGRYAGRIDGWDVVNEIIGDDGNYRPTPWVERIGNGDDVVRNAFRLAERWAPGTELYYNDFNAWRPAKVMAITRMVRMLQAEGIRIDGIGMQGHWGLNYPRTDLIEAAIDAYAALGLKVMITELDVDVLPLSREGQVIGRGLADPQFQLEEFEAWLDPYPDGLPAAVEEQLAQRYEDLFRIFYGRRDKLDRVTFWGVHDGASWKNNSPVPRRTNYPLLFDRNRAPKPAMQRVLRVPRRGIDPAGGAQPK
jgi:endo-1,4-beta-xylanase